MSDDNESRYSHRIYKNDPLKFRSYVNKRVKITGKNKTLYEGIVYTIDPVSESIVLIEGKVGDDMQGQIVVGDSVESIEILGDEDELPELFESKNSNISQSEVQMRKDMVMKLLNDNRFPVTDEGDVIRIKDVISIEPPYRPENCVSPNPLIMMRIRGIISLI